MAQRELNRAGRFFQGLGQGATNVGQSLLQLGLANKQIEAAKANQLAKFEQQKELAGIQFGYDKELAELKGGVQDKLLQTLLKNKIDRAQGKLGATEKTKLGVLDDMELELQLIKQKLGQMGSVGKGFKAADFGLSLIGASGDTKKQVLQNIDPKATSLKQNLEKLKDFYIRLQSGAAVPDPEFQRLGFTFPSTIDTDVVFNQAIQDVQTALVYGRLAKLAQSGSLAEAMDAGYNPQQMQLFKDARNIIKSPRATPEMVKLARTRLAEEFGIKFGFIEEMNAK